MSIWILLLLIAFVWLLYPLAGAANVSADVLDGKRPKGAGFSFLPELIVFSLACIGLAALIDFFAMPWGRWIVAGGCLVTLTMLSCVFVQALRRIRSSKRA